MYIPWARVPKANNQKLLINNAIIEIENATVPNEAPKKKPVRLEVRFMKKLAGMVEKAVPTMTKAKGKVFNIGVGASIAPANPTTIIETKLPAKKKD